MQNDDEIIHIDDLKTSLAIDYGGQIALYSAIGSIALAAVGNTDMFMDLWNEIFNSNSLEAVADLLENNPDAAKIGVENGLHGVDMAGTGIEAASETLADAPGDSFVGFDSMEEREEALTLLKSIPMPNQNVLETIDYLENPISGFENIAGTNNEEIIELLKENGGKIVNDSEAALPDNHHLIDGIGEDNSKGLVVNYDKYNHSDLIGDMKNGGVTLDEPQIDGLKAIGKRSVGNIASRAAFIGGLGAVSGGALGYGHAKKAGDYALANYKAQQLAQPMQFLEEGQQIASELLDRNIASLEGSKS